MDAAARRNRLKKNAAEARASRTQAWLAAALLITYNVIGVLDIASTNVGIASGRAEEANPLIRNFMEHFGAGWIWGRLGLQLLVSAMVLWFPHRVVLTFFSFAVLLNASVVVNNLRIAGIL